MHIRWRGLELPGSVVADPKTLTETYGKFTAEPFERGFGTMPGGVARLSKAHFGVSQRLPFKNSFSPSRRQRRQTGPVIRPMVGFARQFKEVDKK